MLEIDSYFKFKNRTQYSTIRATDAIAPLRCKIIEYGKLKDKSIFYKFMFVL